MGNKKRTVWSISHDIHEYARLESVTAYYKRKPQRSNNNIYGFECFEKKKKSAKKNAQKNEGETRENEQSNIKVLCNSISNWKFKRC
jgi:hypothetical protein